MASKPKDSGSHSEEGREGLTVVRKGRRHGRGGHRRNALQDRLSGCYRRQSQKEEVCHLKVEREGRAKGEA